MAGGGAGRGPWYRLQPVPGPVRPGVAGGAGPFARSARGAGIRRQRLQRGPTGPVPGLRGARAQGGDVRAHLRPACSYRPSHRHPDRPGRPAPGLHARRRGRRRPGGKARAVHCFALFAQQPDRLGRGCHDSFLGRGGRRWAGGGGRGLRPVRLVVGAGPSGRGRPPGCGAHLFQDLVHGRVAPRLPDRPVRGRAGARPGGPAVPPRRLQTGGGPVGLAVLGPDGAPGGGRGGRARTPGGGAWRPARADLVFAGQFRALAPAGARRPRGLARTGRSFGAGARRLEAGRGWKVACAPPWAPPTKTTASSALWPRCWRDRALRPQRAHHQGDVCLAAAGTRWDGPGVSGDRTAVF